MIIPVSHSGRKNFASSWLQDYPNINESGNRPWICNIANPWANLLLIKYSNEGINVVVGDEVIEHFAVIDDVLVWHGGMNLLGKEDAWDNLMRIGSAQVAAELLAIAFG